MKRLMLASLSTLALSLAFTPIALPTTTGEAVAVKPPSGDYNPSDRGNRTVDTSDLSATLPPAGDLNPQDRYNATVDSSQVIAARPPSGDLNPSDRFNRTVDTSDIIYNHTV